MCRAVKMLYFCCFFKKIAIFALSDSKFNYFATVEIVKIGTEILISEFREQTGVFYQLPAIFACRLRSAFEIDDVDMAVGGPHHAVRAS